MSSITNHKSYKAKRKSKPIIKSYSDLISDVPSILSSQNAQYSRTKSIGSGSYGKCYAVINQKSQEQLACKILSLAFIKDDVNKEMVKNEITFHRKLKHEHVVGFVESFTDEQHIYIVQKLCANGTLAEISSQRQRFLVAECRYCVHQILNGIDYIHSKGIVHRDLKLANILIDANMQMKICDFGLAILERDAHLEADILCGTTNYLAPEVVSFNGFEKRSDIWAIGVITYILLYAHKPFEGDDEKSTLGRILRADYRLPSYVDADLKSFFRNVFETNVKNRPNAVECMKLNFFQMHDIPASLSILPPTKKSSAMDISLSHEQSDATKPGAANPVVAKKPTAPQKNPIDCQLKPDGARCELPNSVIENGEHLKVLQKVFQRFSKICDSYAKNGTVKSDVCFSNLTRLPDHEPDYWILRWTFDDVSATGFGYQISDHSIGMLFLDRFHYMRTPDKTDWTVSTSGKLQRIGDPKGRFKQYLMKIATLEKRLIQNGTYDVETPYKRSKLPHLVTWFQTDDAMVMYLSNRTVQINFSKNHKKVIICPHKETITFVLLKICRENFKTVTFDTLDDCEFSTEDFDMLKYLKAIIKSLMTLLSNE